MHLQRLVSRAVLCRSRGSYFWCVSLAHAQARPPTSSLVRSPTARRSTLCSAPRTSLSEQAFLGTATVIQLIPTLDYPGNDALRAKRASSLFGGAALAAAMMVVWFSLWWLNTRSVAPQLKRHLGTGGGSRRECVCASALLRSSARLARSTHSHPRLSLSLRAPDRPTSGSARCSAGRGTTRRMRR